MTNAVKSRNEISWGKDFESPFMCERHVYVLLFGVLSLRSFSIPVFKARLGQILTYTDRYCL